MEDNIWYDIFLENLIEKCPKKAQLIEEIQRLLCIEREAVYRRFRKEVFFPINEIVKIALEWNISLDEIVGIHSGLVPFQMQPINYLSPTNKEMINLQKRARALEHLIDGNDSEYMEVCNKPPRPIYLRFLTLYRFEIFKWNYLYNIDGDKKMLSEIIIPEKISKEFDIYLKNVKRISHSSFILDPMIFEYLVQNIKYFYSILLITEEEKESLKEQLFLLLDYFDEITIKGCYPETKKKVSLYVSQLNINGNYSYYYLEKLKLCRIHAFGKFDVCSFKPEMVANFRRWMNYNKRASIQISETNEKSRIEFFRKQKEIIESL
jgi:hypothetical protein